MSGAIYFVVLIFFLLGVESLPRQGSSLPVVSGHVANITEVPYMALYCSLSHTFRCCGAAILSERYLISAAGCYWAMADDSTIAIVGTDKLYGDGEVYVIEEAYAHPKFNPIPPAIPPSDSTSSEFFYGPKWEYNVVLLKLSKKLKFSEKVRPIPIADEQLELSEGAMLDTIDFEYVSDLKIPTLQKVSVPYISEEKCRENYPILRNYMICTDTAWKNTLDAGLPLVYDGQLVGLLSQHRMYVKDGSLSIYTSVSGVREFIQAILQNEE